MAPAMSGKDLSPAATADARTRLLDAAARLFTEFGYDGTPVTRIADAAGMTPSNLYWHFASKQDLLLAMLTEQYRWSYDYTTRHVPQDAAPDERLAAYVRALVHIQIESLAGSRNHSYLTLANALEPEARRELDEGQRRFLMLLREILQQGREQGMFEIVDLTVVSFAIVHMCEYSFLWYRAGGRLTLPEVENHYAELALNMVRVRPQAGDPHRS